MYGLEEFDMSWHLRIRKKVFWPVKEIMKRRRHIVEVHDDFAEVDVVFFGFHQKVDRFDMEIVEHIVVYNEIAKEESVTYVGREFDFFIQNDVNIEMNVIEDLSITVIPNLELYVHPIMNVVNLDVSCGKKMDFLTGNMVEGFRDVIDVELHDDVLVDVDLNLYVAAKMQKDTTIVTNVDFDDIVDLYVAGGMNIHVSIMDLYIFYQENRF